MEPEIWLVVGRAAQKELRDKWKESDPDGFAQQELRRARWLEAKRSGAAPRAMLIRANPAIAALHDASSREVVVHADETTTLRTEMVRTEMVPAVDDVAAHYPCSGLQRRRGCTRVG